MDNHRTLLKVILNPMLRKFGFSIVSVLEGDKFIKYQIRKYPECCEIISNESKRTTKSN